jgi:ATP-binding cassette, subfamily F, member 3
MLTGSGRSEAAADSIDDARSAAPPGKSDKAPSTAAKSARKRRFPYRKVDDIENDISAHEADLYRLQCDLADPNVLRDGPRVRQIKAQIEAHQAAVKELNEHWEEAVELNW